MGYGVTLQGLQPHGGEYIERLVPVLAVAARSDGVAARVDVGRDVSPTHGANDAGRVLPLESSASTDCSTVRNHVQLRAARPHLAHKPRRALPLPALPQSADRGAMGGGVQGFSAAPALVQDAQRPVPVSPAAAGDDERKSARPLSDGATAAPRSTSAKAAAAPPEAVQASQGAAQAAQGAAARAAEAAVAAPPRGRGRQRRCRRGRSEGGQVSGGSQGVRHCSGRVWP